MLDNFLAKNGRSGVHGKPEVGVINVHRFTFQILGSASINSNMDGMGFGITVILYYYLYSKYTIDLSAYPNGDHSTTIRLFPLICLK